MVRQRLDQRLHAIFAQRRAEEHWGQAPGAIRLHVECRIADAGQLHLPERPDHERLDLALDELGERFGPETVRRAALLGQERRHP